MKLHGFLIGQTETLLAEVLKFAGPAKVYESQDAAVAAILTGQYSHLNGVYTLDDALRPEQDNIAKRLQQAGYRTALVGK